MPTRASLLSQCYQHTCRAEKHSTLSASIQDCQCHCRYFEQRLGIGFLLRLLYHRGVLHGGPKKSRFKIVLICSRSSHLSNRCRRKWSILKFRELCPPFLSKLLHHNSFDLPVRHEIGRLSNSIESCDELRRNDICILNT